MRSSASLEAIRIKDYVWQRYTFSVRSLILVLAPAFLVVAN